MFNIKIILCCIVLLVFCGCQYGEADEWVVYLKRPDGVIDESWKVRSIGSPLLVPCMGGQIQVDVQGDGGTARSIPIVAPTGWSISLRKIRDGRDAVRPGNQ